nr:HD domain-containing protein [Candidatus Thiosymbion oneisti]
MPASWGNRIDEVSEVAGPLLESHAFRRLEDIRFLGLLSPCTPYSEQRPSSLRPRKSPTVPVCDDGTRAEHSLGVALILLDLSRRLALSEDTQRYAIAWGLLHDLGTWPLSHTTEAAFSILTSINSRELRAGMITDSQRVPREFHLGKMLREIGIESDILISLFAGDASLPDDELRLLRQIIMSPITPDTLEGIWRCGVVFGVEVPHPNAVVGTIERDMLFDAMIRRDLSDVILRFWRKKAYIYERFINHPDTISWESRWGAVVLNAFAGISLAESLQLREADIFDRLMGSELPEADKQLRYKAPLRYSVSPPKIKKLPDDLRHLSTLGKALSREPLSVV